MAVSSIQGHAMSSAAGRRALVLKVLRLLGLTVLVAPVAACCVFRSAPPLIAAPPPPPETLPTCPGDPRCDSSREVPQNLR